MYLMLASFLNYSLPSSEVIPNDDLCVTESSSCTFPFARKTQMWCFTPVLDTTELSGKKMGQILEFSGYEIDFLFCQITSHFLKVQSLASLGSGVGEEENDLLHPVIYVRNRATN
jgi:hypothetical protein